ncbi:MAG: PD40 domain-containing protein [Ruminococcus sp.]|nr:PD40 domain-containing protein [Ruminococcus sp.]
MKAAKTFIPLLCIITAGVRLPLFVHAESEILTNGQLLYHSYSSYTAMDSVIYNSDMRTGKQTEITSDHFINGMNADFGSHPYDIVFMAIDPAADEWDIYRYNRISKKLINLTANSGYRNEDPKFSPDGQKIIFKRGYWSHETDDFVYDLAEMHLASGNIRMLTDDLPEQSMPVYSADGTAVYYSLLDKGETGIFRLSLMQENSVQECIFAESGISSYYPMISGENLYFTKWISADLPNDSIVRLTDGKPVSLPFNSNVYNCSDSFPLADGSMFYSSTQNGSYDLFFYDGSISHPLTMLHTERNELGASFFSDAEAAVLIRNTADYLVQKEYTECNMDADENGIVNVIDLVYFKQLRTPL